MKYYSTRNKMEKASLKEAVMRGLAPGGGLYMPVEIPVLRRDELEEIRELDLTGIAVLLSQKLFGDDLPQGELADLAADAVNFDTPVVKVEEGIYALELFHGPTLAFKDVGARFMARMLGVFTRGLNRPVHVLVATSGDTGSAVANGFLGVDGVQVHVLYPSGGVSSIQEKQFSTLGGNITALEVDGTFDDCQKLVKDAFSDDAIRSRMILTSANSINLARFLPQAFYYFRAWNQVPADSPVISVPSGNFGNLTAGFVARDMGLPVHRFIAACNANDVVPEYLETGTFRPRPSIATIANAMDIGNPSNFERILELFGNRHDHLVRHLAGYSYTDTSIREIIRQVYHETGYLCDPHGATGYEALRQYRLSHPDSTGIFLETAHPAKFSEVVEEETGTRVPVPERLASFAQREKQSIPLDNTYTAFREYLARATEKK